ncbi:MAG: 2-keto-4-pentenoate hydratase [Pandoraea sp.]|nr:2-keto-4-pentenoate hydratase [Pandoraea sp.]
MSNSPVIQAFAERLRRAEATRQAIASIRGEIAPDDMASAYAVQQCNVAARAATGERIVGRKIGLTSLAVQRQLGVDQPDFGALFAGMAYGDAQPMPLASLIQPKVEAEIALVIERDLTCEKHTFADILRATAYAVAAVEVVDSRIEQWNIRFVDTVADNASSALFVLGSRPVALADRMAQLGTPLRAGDVVLTGALGPMVPVTEAGTFVTEIEGLGSVRATFA